MMRADPRYSAKLTLCLAAVYIIWGSTFLVTKVAATHLPVALFSAVRFLTAGAVLTLVARFVFKHPFPRRLIDWRHVLVTGFFMVVASNGLNAWAIQYIPSGQSALLNGTAAFWIAGLGVFGRRGHPLTRWAIVGLSIGFAGTALMMVPRGELHAASLLAQLGVLGAGLSFSIGTLYYRSADTPVDSLMFMAMQLFAGGIMLMIVALIHGDIARWTFSPPGMLALTYLTFVSSCLAFTAYGWLTRNAPPAIIGTYSYVNPAIATFLGWQFMHESLSRIQLVGMLIIIVGVSILTMPGGSVTDPKTLDEPKAA
jgi:drug/metabolite transporter (DMT)-like permease